MDFNNHVDRSYYPSKAIREYQDRGMMKWQGYYLSEHTSAMKIWREEEQLTKIDLVGKEELLFLLTQVANNKTAVQLTIFDNRSYVYFRGTVKEVVSLEEIVFEVTKNQFKRIKIEKIVRIEQIKKV